MGEAIAGALPLAVTIAATPVPIMALIPVLTGPRARSSGPAFLVGWLVALAGLGALLLVLAGPADPSEGGDPAGWTGWVHLGLGVLLLALALKSWSGRTRRGDPTETPGWMDTLATMTPIRAAGLGAFLGAGNPKNLLLVVGGVAAVAETGIAGVAQAGAWTVFVVVASVGVCLPVAILLVGGAGAGAALERLGAWMARHGAVIMAVLLLALGIGQLARALAILG